MAKAKAKRRANNFTISLASVAGFVPLAKTLYDGYQFGGFSTMLNELSASMTGYNPEVKVWRAQTLMKGAVPVVIGLAVHKVASKLGINRMLGRAKVPFLRV